MDQHTPESDVAYGHDQVPSDPTDGDRFTCSRCGVTSEYVELLELPGEWVDVTPLGEARS